MKHLTFGTERGGVEEALLAGEQQGQRGKGVEGCVCKCEKGPRGVGVGEGA